MSKASTTRPPTKKQPRVPARSAPTPRGVSLSPVKPGADDGADDGAGEESPLATPPVDPQSSARRYDLARSLIRSVPNFPRNGILFKDITPMLADPRAFHMILDGLAEQFIGDHVDVIAGIEARGFIFGGALAARLNASFVPLRKPGKLPAETDRVSYDLEYGSAALEIHVDSIESGAKVVIVDDLLATGGTAVAAGELVKRQGGYIAAYAFVVELDFLGGRERLAPAPVLSLMSYGAGD
jgi:adenine phosphoribosyltransferase